jgi:hypothetical protein
VSRDVSLRVYTTADLYLFTATDYTRGVGGVSTSTIIIFRHAALICVHTALQWAVGRNGSGCRYAIVFFDLLIPSIYKLLCTLEQSLKLDIYCVVREIRRVTKSSKSKSHDPYAPRTFRRRARVQPSYGTARVRKR